MPDKFSIKDLPDVSSLEDDSKYLVTGRLLKVFYDVLKQVWRGENVNKGSNVLKRPYGDGGYTLSATGGSDSNAAANIAWPYKVYNKSYHSAGQVQINGGDGFVATLSSPYHVAQVNSTNNDVSTGSPATYPKLAVSGNGVVYIHVSLTTTSGTTQISSGSDAVSVLFASDAPDSDEAYPPTYGIQVIATITGYSVDAHGNVSFQVNNSNNYGFTMVALCNGVVQFT
jgi:hypothetical protein